MYWSTLRRSRRDCVNRKAVGCIIAALATVAADCPGVAPLDPGSETGIVRVEVNGLAGNASSGGSATVTPTGETAGDPFLVDVPASGMSEASGVPVGSYEVSYAPPGGHTVAPGESTLKSLAVTKDQTAGVAFAVVANGGNPPPPPPPPPQSIPSCQATGSQQCEATGGGTCWYVAADGDDGNAGTLEAPLRTPQAGVNNASPGDVVYLMPGAPFGVEHTFAGPNNSVTGTPERLLVSISSGVNAGTADNPITLKSYPGQSCAVIQGSETEDIRLWVSRPYWRVENLVINGGNIGVGERFAADVHDVWIVGNEVFNYRTMSGSNWGIIKIDESNPSPYNIYIEGNVMHDMNDGGTPWNQEGDLEHHAGFALVQSSGLVVFRNNVIYNAPSAFYFKRDHPGPTVVQGNIIFNVVTLGQWRSANTTFERNVVFGVLDGGGPRTRGGATGNVFRRNTFADMDHVVNLDGPMDGHTVEDNVVFGPGYLLRFFGASGDVAQSQLDRNCFITPQSFTALRVQGENTTYTLDEFRATFGKETNSIRLIETSKAAVFADPNDADFSLIGAAATQCGGKGAYD